MDLIGTIHGDCLGLCYCQQDLSRSAYICLIIHLHDWQSMSMEESIKRIVINLEWSPPLLLHYCSDQFIDVKGVRYAYRYFGAATEIPLVFNIHFRGTVDHWDPDFINPIASTRPVILIDNSGVGRSSGEIPESYAGWAKNIVDVIEALGIKQVDVFGFSMGGFVAQLIALNAPHLVRKLILAGTGPSAGPDVKNGEPEYLGLLSNAATEEENHNAFLKTFYSPSDKKQALAELWWKRMTSARTDRVDYVGPDGTQRQLAAAVKWLGGEFREEGSYDRLDQIKIPVFIANGSNDLLIPTVNSWVLWKKMVNADAHLHLFPDSGHGFLNEYADIFSKQVISFLDA
ncbi:Alpha/Beta hydrolase protein [Lipomyces tetrasporus]|uniref:Alpha/Beta hydrolase protein n=1 Tax=Lipomyces tetrasporus TaxID=54092 RepID=A0AAD7QNI4_9ASCO|nr:Alpha/Beta hydrolase protein [Lipomyces tetrasporus]KAJ8098585.1 Alpha/Beta hydrolase protein [Lipomyces tetrasporus]